MKNLLKLGFIAVSAWLLLAACEKKDQPVDNSIEGTYKGTLSQVNGLKSINGILNSKTAGEEVVETATAEISITGENEIEVHCFGTNLDTTFMLNYYEHGDRIYVCLTGDDFEQMYGHKLGYGHMSGSMMSDIDDDETQWTHHMNEEHKEGDEHFGGFNMDTHSFGYTIKNIG